METRGPGAVLACGFFLFLVLVVVSWIEELHSFFFFFSFPYSFYTGGGVRRPTRATAECCFRDMIDSISME